MAIWDKLRLELDRAGRVAQEALDEGRLRLDLHRARQSADRFAQRLGYAVHHAKKAGTELSPEEFVAHSNNLSAAEAEVARLETLIEENARKRGGANVPSSAGGGASTSTGTRGGERSGGTGGSPTSSPPGPTPGSPTSSTP